jgi:hypothetical protein
LTFANDSTSIAGQYDINNVKLVQAITFFCGTGRAPLHTTPHRVTSAGTQAMDTKQFDILLEIGRDATPRGVISNKGATPKPIASLLEREGSV